MIALSIYMMRSFHMEVGANLVLKRQLSHRYGCGKANVTCALFEPQPRFLNLTTQRAEALGNTMYLPFAAWIRNESLDLHLHHDFFGVGSSIYNRSIFLRSAASKQQRVSIVRVPALDLAEWMERWVPHGVRLTAHIDVEGAECARPALNPYSVHCLPRAHRSP